MMSQPALFMALGLCFSIHRAAARRTAVAVLQEEDGVWGSVVFHQWSRDGPVFLSALLQNIFVGFRAQSLRPQTGLPSLEDKPKSVISNPLLLAFSELVLPISSDRAL